MSGEQLHPHPEHVWVRMTYENGQTHLCPIWYCRHVAQDFVLEPPPPAGEGYDSAWPPSEDPCWARLARPTAQRLEPGPTAWNNLVRWGKRARHREDLLANVLSWLELHHLAECKAGLWALTEEGKAWLRSAER